MSVRRGPGGGATGGHAARPGSCRGAVGAGAALGVALGVAVAGGALEISSRLTGGGLKLEDFHFAWFVVAGVSLLSAVPFLRLPPDAGSDVSGHRARPGRLSDG